MTFEERVALLQRTYDAFNRRDIEGALSALDPEVEWPNVLERRVIYGREGVSQYWRRQFQLVDSQVMPTGFSRQGDLVIVSVRQVVRDLQSNQVREQAVAHAYTFRGGLVARMEVYATPDEARVVT
jgi:ketosteroid isomerase-like protein